MEEQACFDLPVKTKAIFVMLFTFVLNLTFWIRSSLIFESQSHYNKILFITFWLYLHIVVMPIMQSCTFTNCTMYHNLLCSHNLWQRVDIDSIYFVDLMQHLPKIQFYCI